MKSGITLLSIVIFALAASFGFAQNPPSPPPPPDPAAMAQHQVQVMTTLLSLTSAQQQQALTLFTTAATSEASLHEQDRAAHDAIETAVKSNDAAGISQAAATIGSIAAQRAEIHAKAEAALYQILTPAQQSKLAQLKQLGPGLGMGPGPGGPGPRP